MQFKPRQTGRSTKRLMTQQVLGSQDCPTVSKVPCNSSIFKKYHFLQTSTIHIIAVPLSATHTIDVRTLIINSGLILHCPVRSRLDPWERQHCPNVEKNGYSKSRDPKIWISKSPSLRKHGFVRSGHCAVIIYAMQCSVILLLFKKQVVCGHNRTDLKIVRPDFYNRVLILLGWN